MASAARKVDTKVANLLPKVAILKKTGLKPLYNRFLIVTFKDYLQELVPNLFGTSPKLVLNKFLVQFKK